MTWWIICFCAVILTICAKWYFSTSVERLRSGLLRQQREALELKGELGDVRQEAKNRGRVVREKEADIKRIKSNIAQLEGEIRGLRDEIKEKRGT